MNYAWEQREGGARINYEYELGRLVKRGTSSYAYDNLGNCTNYNGTNLTWHRGKLLKKYGTTSYSYDNQGVRFRKERGAEIIKYYHEGGKLIDEVRQKGKEKTVIEYLYDIEGLMGMKIGRTEYHYLKDGKGNVRALLKAERLEYEDKLIARYDYDAWGNCVVKNGDGTINTDEEFIGNINPIRWKSQYYDTESGLYYIDGRYYSPVTKQYLSMENVESLIANAGSVYGLNGYLLTLTNPVNMVYNGYTIETNTELAYEAPELSAWQAFWGSTLGKAVAIGLVWLAAVVSMATGNIGGFLAAMGMTVCSLALGGVISGYQSWRQGNGFWRGFDNYINYNWSQSFAITATLVVIDCGIRAVAAVISNAGSKTAPANTVKKVDEVPIDVKETVVYGKAHGSVEHQAKINEITGDMLKSNKYSEIYLNRSLKTAGLNGGQRPDIIGKAKDGTVIAYEVASKTQTTGSYAGRKLLKKIELMQLNNPAVNFDLIWLFG